MNHKKFLRATKISLVGAVLVWQIACGLSETQLDQSPKNIAENFAYPIGKT